MRIIHIIAISFFGLVLDASAGIANYSEQSAKERLKSVQNQIRNVRNDLSRRKGEAATLQAQLELTESKIGRIVRRLANVNREQTRLNDRQSKLDSRKRNLQLDLNNQQDVLSRQLRAAYVMGRQQKIKLLLNQQEPSSIGRTLMYYDYLNKNRSDQILQIKDTLLELTRLEHEISDNRKQLSQLRNQLQITRHRLDKARNKRERTLASLRMELQKQGKVLENLLVDERELQHVIEEIQKVLADIPQLGSGHATFNDLKGKLSCPTSSPAIQPRALRSISGRLKWHGVLIDAKSNQSVHAVSHGRVAFADWMRGYGLLIIIDHGQGYMSLYGHNESLYKEVGDWVESGDIISTVGDSGGQNMPGLYFEIRHKGKPVDPVDWFSSRFVVVKSVSK